MRFLHVSLCDNVSPPTFLVQALFACPPFSSRSQGAAECGLQSQTTGPTSGPLTSLGLITQPLWALVPSAQPELQKLSRGPPAEASGKRLLSSPPFAWESQPPSFLCTLRPPWSSAAMAWAGSPTPSQGSGSGSHTSLVPKVSLSLWGLRRSSWEEAPGSSPWMQGSGSQRASSQQALAWTCAQWPHPA